MNKKNFFIFSGISNTSTVLSCDDHLWIKKLDKYYASIINLKIGKMLKFMPLGIPWCLEVVLKKFYRYMESKQKRENY